MPRDDWLNHVTRGKRIEIHGSAHGDPLAGSGISRVSLRKRILLALIGVALLAWLGWIAYSIVSSEDPEEDPVPITGQP